MVVTHIICALLSYVAFLAACISGALFLIQERQLKRKTIGRLFHRLPSLDALDRVNFIAISAGFGLLSLGFASGLIGTRMLLGRWWMSDAKEYLTLLVWATYLAMWLVRLRSTLRGHRVALLSILGFSFVLFAVIGTTWVIPSWHPYL